jgi:hypothetical protein
MVPGSTGRPTGTWYLRPRGLLYCAVLVGSEDLPYSTGTSTSTGTWYQVPVVYWYGTVPYRYTLEANYLTS